MESQSKDLLGDLPDHVIHHIFSFLGDNDIARLSFLSRRFQTLCTSSPYFSFSLPHSHNTSCSCAPFANYINTILKQRPQGLKIHRLQFSCDSCEDSICHEDWIKQVIQACNVEELFLEYKLPSIFQSVYSCQSLKVLQLNMNNVVVNLPKIKLASLETLHMDSIITHDSIGQWVSKSFPSLKRLTLKGINMTLFNQPQDLTIQSSSLEDLTIYDCCSFKPVRIFTENLRNMYFYCYYHLCSRGNGNKLLVEICAPNIHKFRWRGSAQRLSYDEGTFKTLYVAIITELSSSTSKNLLLELVQAVRWARIVYTHSNILEDLLKSPPILFENLRHLNLILGSSKKLVAECIVPFLQRLENLEYTLTIANPYHKFFVFEVYEYVYEDIIDSSFKWALRENCCGVGLKSIKGLKEVELTILEFNSEMALLIGMLLKYGKDLEKMTITYPSYYKRCMTQKGMQYIQSFERASSSLSLSLVPREDYMYKVT